MQKIPAGWKTTLSKTMQIKQANILVASAFFSAGVFYQANALAQNPNASHPMIWDAHSHYAKADTEAVSHDEVIQILDRNNVQKILITSTPNSGTLKLAKFAPNRIIPFLSVYRTKADKRDWMHRIEVLDEAKKAIATGRYVGIGELHIFAKDKKSPVLKGLVELAKEHQMPMLIHGDAEIIDEIFSIDPKARILWAHLGTQPKISLLKTMLDKYPDNLWIDTSVRDKQLLATGRLDSQWREFFMDYETRFLVAIDTFSVNRWKTYDSVVKDIHHWLGDLPAGVAQKLAHENAKTFFALEK
ncbi:amidohydrolase family protein [Thiomicrorhabdus indica]|uniref:amidohydrolase family protein n=1 Tax=Thiomicrorhabdus indica TaxID=2267253 RepID=UPI00102DCB91|nr:TatD family hydrolase [Thiomicrorhabdus indica]